MPDTSFDSLLHSLQQAAFGYFERAVNPANGLVSDRLPLGRGFSQAIPCSIAAVGFALSCYPVAVERGWMKRGDAAKLTLNTLRFFGDCAQGTAPDASGYKGFYYHFLDMKQGKRFTSFKRCEVSTIDTALLLAGASVVARFFDRDTHFERELRERAETLVARADWHWALNRDEARRPMKGETSAEASQGASLEAAPRAVSHGWTPERGFLRARWQGYNEALILYAMGLSSPSFPLPAASYEAWTQTYKWKTLYGHEFLYAGSFFIHQFSHCWIDFRGIQDPYMSTHASDYFQNSRRATQIQHEYALRNPRGFADYNGDNWGICAGDGPESKTRNHDTSTKTRRFLGYRARGVPFGPDDGTIAPWSTVAALPFAPELVMPFIEQAVAKEKRRGMSTHAAFDELLLTHNTQFSGGWRADEHFALALGPIVLMIENQRSGLLWELMRGSHIDIGLHRANFNGGWLDAPLE